MRSLSYVLSLLTAVATLVCLTPSARALPGMLSDGRDGYALKIPLPEGWTRSGNYEFANAAQKLEVDMRLLNSKFTAQVAVQQLSEQFTSPSNGPVTVSVSPDQQLAIFTSERPALEGGAIPARTFLGVVATYGTWYEKSVVVRASWEADAAGNQKKDVIEFVKARVAESGSGRGSRVVGIAPEGWTVTPTSERPVEAVYANAQLQASAVEAAYEWHGDAYGAADLRRKQLLKGGLTCGDIVQIADDTAQVTCTNVAGDVTTVGARVAKSVVRSMPRTGVVVLLNGTWPAVATARAEADFAKLLSTVDAIDL